MDSNTVSTIVILAAGFCLGFLTGYLVSLKTSVTILKSTGKQLLLSNKLIEQQDKVITAYKEYKESAKKLIAGQERVITLLERKDKDHVAS